MLTRIVPVLIAVLVPVGLAPPAFAQSASSRTRAADPQSSVLSPNRAVARPAASPAAPASQLPRYCDLQRVCTINPVFAIGMKCDGVTDDSAALQAALNGANDPGLGNVKIILPPGICIIDPVAAITINSALWLQGAGRRGTTLKRKDSSAGGALLTFNSNGITLSDFAIDGNKGGTGITAPADSISINAPSNDVTITRMRFLNATQSDISSLATGDGIFISDWLVSDNDFDNGGTPDCAAAIHCGNVFLRQPLGVRIIGNRSNSSQHFALFSSIPGGGQVEIGENVLTRLNGFGVALGGGVFGAAGAHIHNNSMTSLSSDAFNLIDVAFWYDFTVDHNVLYHNGLVSPPNGSPTSCIADFPPAFHGEVDGNLCYAVPTTAINVSGIAMGGDDISVTNNFVQGASTAGISYVIGSQGAIRGVRIIGNTTKNNGQGAPGHHAGIELYLGIGGPDLAGLADVVIQGNHSYDDQASQTQGYGIGITLFDKTTNIFNVIIQGNDVVGNLNAGILNRATDLPGLVIRDNFGYNPVGAMTAPPFPASTDGPFLNATGIDATVYITSGSSPIKISINGVPVSALSVPGGGVVSNPIRLPANQRITLSYVAGGTPSWQWIAD